MATLYTHAAVGLALGRVCCARRMPVAFWALAGLLPVVPELDAFCNAPYGTALGHRGLTRSLVACKAEEISTRTGGYILLQLMFDFATPAVTTISNLFLASDYVQTLTDLATMEGACEAARHAVNGILDASGSDEDECEIFPLREPAFFEPFKAVDLLRWKLGLPNTGLPFV